MAISRPGVSAAFSKLERGARRNNPVEQYEAFMKSVLPLLERSSVKTAAPTGSEPGDSGSGSVKRVLFQALGQPDLSPEIRGALDELQLSAGWVRNHLLPIGTWSERLRKAIRDGLPIREGAVVARISRTVLQQNRKVRKQGRAGEQPPDVSSRLTGTSNVTARALIDAYEAFVIEPFYEARTRIQEVRIPESEVLALVRYRVMLVLAERSDQTPPRTKRKNSRAETLDLTRKHSFAQRSGGERGVWLYRPLALEQIQRESLHPHVARRIIHAYAPPEGGYILDPMAGSGTVVRAALAMGHEVWAGDLQPESSLIQRYDASANQARPWPPAEVRRVDLLVLHPPTYATWRLTSGPRPTAQTYFTFIRKVLERHSRLVDPAGHVVLIVQPFHEENRDVRSVLLLKPPLSHPSAVALHVAAALDGRQAWHIVAFSNRSFAPEFPAETGRTAKGRPNSPTSAAE